MKDVEKKGVTRPVQVHIRTHSHRTGDSLTHHQGLHEKAEIEPEKGVAQQRAGLGLGEDPGRDGREWCLDHHGPEPGPEEAHGAVAFPGAEGQLMG